MGPTMTSPAAEKRDRSVHPVDVLAFVCELALLVTLAVAGSGLGHRVAWHIVLAIALPLVAAGIWSVFMAPASKRRLHDPWRYLAQVALFALTAWLAAEAGRTWWGVIFAVTASVVLGLTRLIADNPRGQSHRRA
jgi:NhaP-type Na+/H+ or K+/H+ antiporter